MINTTLNIFDVAFTAAEQIERIEYSAITKKVINISATLAAIAVAVTSYIFTALQLFWLNYSEVITTRCFQFIITAADFAGACYFAGRNLRPVINLWVARLADTAFYKLAAAM